MFRTKSRQERAVEAARLHADAVRLHAATLTGQAMGQAASLRERVAPGAAVALDRSAHAADVARHWAEPRVGAARSWATPRLEKARERGVEVAAPRVGHAAESLAPLVDAARDRIVEDVLPRIVEVVTAAAAAAAAKTDEARDSTQEALAEVRKQTQPAKRAGRGRRFLLVSGALVAAAGGGYAAWRASQPDDDPWAATTGTASPRPAGTSGGPSSRLSQTSAGSAPDSALGGGSLAASTADVDTPTPDGVAASDAEVALEGGAASGALDNDGAAEVPGTETSGADGSQDDSSTTRPRSTTAEDIPPA